ncbi:hypothetical protein [Marinospirillum perlucidum]|uniref:hypothetical protein n=1 Tax=Marinospirillum perlucidum TaxID=1982602 RepID=UPI000DF2EEDA|nr:hypothetical protein [Marinospirillum perlucidum]
MDRKKLKLRLKQLPAMKDEPLRKLWSETRDYCNQWDRPRTLWKEEDTRNVDYYRLRRLEAAALLLLLGRGDLKRFSMRDAAPPILEYFKHANQAPMNEGEPRELLEFLLAFKQEYPALENDVDGLLTRIVDQCPDLLQHNFKEDPQWFRYFFGFAKGLRHRSQVYAHGKIIPQYQLVGKMQDLYYDSLAELLEALAAGLEEDGEADRGRQRIKLATALEGAGGHLRQAAESLKEAWRYCEPYVDKTRKKSQLEHIFDPDVVRNTRISHWVHGYLLGLRMQGETSDVPVDPLSPLHGKNYPQEIAKDPDFEGMVAALIPALSLWTGQEEKELEQEINALIQRDVGTHRPGSLK